MSEALDKINASYRNHVEFKRQVLKDLLDKCTKDQQDFFRRIYPNGVPEESLNSTITLCERTIAKNERKNKDN